MLQTIGEKIDLHAHWPAAPFPGLRPFQSTEDPDESLVFYGRNREKDEILGRLNSSHLVFVVGPSGCGKSSLVKVGVLPALEAGLLTRAGANWQIAEMRPGDRPLRNLSAALATFVPDGPARAEFAENVFDVLRKEDNGLWLVAENVAPRVAAQPLLIHIDQFEEIFGSQVTSEEECGLLLDAIISFTNKPHPNMYVIATMRTDFLGRCSNYPKLADVINATLFVTPVLRDEDLKNVIVLPIEDYHGLIEPELVATIVKEASSEFGYNPDHLPLLQHALLWLWNRSVAAAGLSIPAPTPNAEPPPRPIVVSKQLYVEHGGLKGILNEHADEMFGRLNSTQQQIAETMFRRISERDAENRYRRSPATLETIAKLAGCAVADLEKVIVVFSHPDASFLECRQLAAGTGKFVDVSHESLIRQWDRLRKWADEEAEKFRRFRDLSGCAVEWHYQGRSKYFLKSGGEIELHERWWKENGPTVTWAERYAFDTRGVGSVAALLALTKDYLAESRKLHKRNAWRHWLAWVMPLAAGVILIVAGALFYAYDQQQESKRQKKEAMRAAELAQLRDQFLIARAEDYLDQSPTLALLVALSGPAENRHLERFAYSVLQNLRANLVIPAKNQFQTASFSPDGRFLLYSRANRFIFWDLAARRAVDEYSPSNVNPAMRARWSDDGNWIISGNMSSQTVLWAPCSRPALKVIFPNCTGQTEDDTRTIASADRASWPSTLSPNGRYLLSGGWGTFAMFWDLAKHPSEPISLRAASAGFSLAFDKDSTFFAVGSSNGSVHVRATSQPEEKRAELSLSNKLGTPTSGSPSDAPPEDKDAMVVLPVSSLAFSPTDPDRLVAATTDGTVTLWDWQQQIVVAQYKTGSNGWIGVAFDRTGKLIAVTSQDGMIRLWNPDTHDKTILLGHRQATWSAEFNRTSDLLVSASGESIRLWNLKPALAPSPLETPPQLIGVATVGGANETVSLTDEQGKTISVKMAAFMDRPRAAALSGDGRRLLLADKASLRLFAVEETLGEPLVTFAVPGVEWSKVGFAQGGERLVGQTKDGRFFAWPYFKDLKSLRSFATAALPFDDVGLKADLKALEKCRLGLTLWEECAHTVSADPDASSRRGTQW